MSDPRIETLGHGFLAESQERTESGTGVTHLPDCPCNNADERGYFLISATTNRCVSCTCEEGKSGVRNAR